MLYGIQIYFIVFQFISYFFVQFVKELQKIVFKNIVKVLIYYIDYIYYIY